MISKLNRSVPTLNNGLKNIIIKYQIPNSIIINIHSHCKNSVFPKIGKIHNRLKKQNTETFR